MRKKVGIIGYGYVGKAIEAFFEGKFEVVIYDPLLGYTNREAVASVDLAIICVPTPMQADGSVDTSSVEEILMWLRVPSIVIKSTISPGTTKKLSERFMLADRLVFSPEFIGEGGYEVPFWEGVPHPSDMRKHHFHVLGGEVQAREKVLPFFQKVAGPFVQYRLTDSTTAELMKYMENVWIASKVSFVNEFYDIARTFGVDFNELRELWLLDGRVGRSHTLVYPDNRGFGGKCIPKDTYGLYRALQEAGHESNVLRNLLEQNAIWQQNNNQSPNAGSGQ
jgi:UDPglucose 6-dehydrogenase